MFHVEKALGFEWALEGVDKNKFEFSVISIKVPENSPFEQFCKDRNIEFHRIDYASKADLLAAFLKVYRLLRKIKPDAVHCHIFEADLIGLLAAKLAGVKKRIFTRHHSTYHHNIAPGGKKYDLLINKLATHIISISDNVSLILKDKEGVSAEKIQLIHHGFKLDFFNNISNERIETVQQKYNPANRHPVIGVISRYTEWKGIKYTIQAFHRLLEKYPDALLILANAKGNDLEIKTMVKALPESHYKEIIFEQDNAALFKLFDLFIHVPVDAEAEAFGQIYIEALAVGVPSIFTLSGVAREFIKDGENALVVDFRNAEQIYNAACRLLEDKRLQHHLIENGKKSIERDFALPIMIRKLEKIYSM